MPTEHAAVTWATSSRGWENKSPCLDFSRLGLKTVSSQQALSVKQAFKTSPITLYYIHVYGNVTDVPQL